MEGKIVVYTACNNGSSSVISKDGELYMFGKDAIYSDSSSKFNLNTFHFYAKKVQYETLSIGKMYLEN